MRRRFFKAESLPEYYLMENEYIGGSLHANICAPMGYARFRLEDREGPLEGLTKVEGQES